MSSAGERGTRRSAVRCGVLCTLVAALASCGQPTIPHDKRPVGASMDDHFVAMVALREAIIRADLYTAKKRAEALQGELVENARHPHHWQKSIAETKQAVAKLIESQRLEDVARHTAATAATCGACHARLEVRAAGPIATPTTALQTPDDYMRRHRVATENLWIGLIGPSDAAWRAGAKALAEVGSFPGAQERAPSYRDRAEHLERLGRWANEAGDRKTRTAVYGQLLASCASCHQLISGSK